MDLTYNGAKLDFHCKPLNEVDSEDCISRQYLKEPLLTNIDNDYRKGWNNALEAVYRTAPTVYPKSDATYCKLVDCIDREYTAKYVEEFANNEYVSEHEAETIYLIAEGVRHIPTVYPKSDAEDITFKDDNAVSRLSVRDIIYANAYELGYPDGSSEYVVNRDEAIKYLMELPTVYPKSDKEDITFKGDSSSEYVVSRDEAIKYLMELRSVYLNTTFDDMKAEIDRLLGELTGENTDGNDN